MEGGEDLMRGTHALSHTASCFQQPSSAKKQSPRKAVSKESAPVVDMMEVSQLSDAELAAKLREYGVDVGPILGERRFQILGRAALKKSG